MELARENGLSASTDLAARIVRINGYYENRYPEGYGLGSLDCRSIVEVDEAVFEIWDSFKAVNADYYYTAGLMIPVISVMSETCRGREVHPVVEQPFLILTFDNDSSEKFVGKLGFRQLSK